MILSLIGSIVHFLVNAYILVLFIRMILDWVAVLASAWRPRGLVSSLIDAVYQLTEPHCAGYANISALFHWVPSTSMWHSSFFISFSLLLISSFNVCQMPIFRKKSVVPC